MNALLPLTLLCALALPAAARQLNLGLVEVAASASAQAKQGGGPEAPDEQGSDLLRFKRNGDSLHGSFAGLQGTKIIWKRPDLDTPLEVATTNLNQIAFNGGRAREKVAPGSYLRLRNGDELPGTIVSLNAESLTLDSPVAGRLDIPRAQLAALHPSPRSGRLLYSGPYHREDWYVLGDQKEGGEESEEKPKEPAEAPDEEKSDEEWIHAGAAWYSNGSAPLILDAKLPDRARISFKMAWRNRLNATFAFHADLRRPVQQADEADEAKKAQAAAEDQNEEKKDEKAVIPPLEWEEALDLTAEEGVLPWVGPRTRNNHAQTYGSAYVMTVHSSYPQLYHCGFSESGTPLVNRQRTIHNGIQFDQDTEAEFELRLDRKNKHLSLYVNGSYVMQWDETSDYAGKGGVFAIAANANSLLRISDLVISEWNGMNDAARSMQHDSRDIILLNNGTDRFSGEITGI
ncbi:MAG: hypothetical protein ACQKBY_07945, partial [Verrucomicrobiales bacterium]